MFGLMASRPLRTQKAASVNDDQLGIALLSDSASEHQISRREGVASYFSRGLLTWDDTWIP